MEHGRTLDDRWNPVKPERFAALLLESRRSAFGGPTRRTRVSARRVFEQGPPELSAARVRSGLPARAVVVGAPLDVQVRE
jgi:hypothetical protein